jgi:hypothetical protein
VVSEENKVGKIENPHQVKGQVHSKLYKSSWVQYKHTPTLAGTVWLYDVFSFVH